MTTGVSSAGGFLSLLEEDENDLKVYALEKLNVMADEFWAEISDSLLLIEVLHEDKDFPARELAALVAAKVYYHIGQFNSAMVFALSAGTLFDINDPSEFVQTTLAKCIDEYVRQSNAKVEDKSDVPLDKLTQVVENVFERCLERGEYKYALGVAIEARRLDKVEQMIEASSDTVSMLEFCFKVCTTAIDSKKFRLQVLSILVKLYTEMPTPNWIRICEIHLLLDDASSVVSVLKSLMEGKEDDQLIGYQIAFDLANDATQHFREALLKDLPDIEEAKKDEPNVPIANVRTILTGKTSTGLFLEFLHRNNHTDMRILRNIKAATELRGQAEARSSIVYSSLVLCNGFMNAGTTNDFFLRQNNDWLSRATNWSKFTATASLGVIQKGHLKESRSLLSEFLPRDGAASSSAYSEAGSLFALGLIHANHGEEVTPYLREQLFSTRANEVVQHGASLGLGVAAMATGNEVLFEDIKTKILYLDSAVAGEAAGIAMGLVMLGSASSSALSDMLAYSGDTQHEKIIRGLAMGMALIMYGREEEADTLIEQLRLSKDPILRYGAMNTIALAYAGTANNDAITHLLHVAVSDVSDDVRRAAVTALGFILCNHADQCPKLVSLLSSSYNPHVRYGACLAVGISCAGTGLKEAVDLLEPMTKDKTDFVRQGAFIGMAMVLQQISKVQEPRVEGFRSLLLDRIGDKHEETMAKFGAILAAGILDTGGRNCTIELHSRTGQKSLTAIVGIALFKEYWYWHPLAHFFSLGLKPTAFIGLNRNLEMPVFTFKSNAPPSMFAYPERLKPPTKKTAKKVKTYELSVTKKQKRRTAQKEKEKEEQGKKEAGEQPMEVEKEEEKPKEDAEEPEKEQEEEEMQKEPEPEPDFLLVENPCRVTPTQLHLVSFDTDTRYKPVKRVNASGIVMLKDTKPGEEVQLVTPKPPPINEEFADIDEEPAPPEPFIYDPTKEKYLD